MERACALSLTDILQPPEGDSITFGPRCLVSATLPYQRPRPDSLRDGCWVRRNGRYVLWVQGGPDGIPYGAYPRLFAIWLTREAILTGRKRIHTDRTFKGFCKTLDIDTSRGKRGCGRYLRTAVVRLLSSRVGFRIDEPLRTCEQPMQIAASFDLWWSSTDDTLKEGYIELSDTFFDEITTHYIPIDLRVIRGLTRSPLALDLYQWLAYRYFNMRRPVARHISWRQLQGQFGTTFARPRDFKRLFCKALILVHTVYPQARFDVEDAGIVLYKSPTPVPELRLNSRRLG